MMAKRLGWVLITYATRHLVWLVLIVYALLSAQILMGRSTPTLRTAHPRIELPAAALRTVGELERLQAEGRLDQVEYLEFQHLWIDMQRARTADGEGPLPKAVTVPASDLALLKQMPALRGLKLDYLTVQQHGLAPLAELSRLELLSLAGTRAPAEELVHLAGLQQLRAIDLSQVDFAGGLQHLSGLPHLELLVVSSFEYLNDRALADLRHLPHLQTLVLAPILASDGERFVTEQGLSALEQLPSLRTVYVRGSTLTTDAHAAVRRLLPHVSVRRMEYDATRVNRFRLLMLATLFLTGMLCIHVAGQFAQPASRLLPRFAAVHLAVPAAVLLIMATFHTLLLWQAGAEVIMAATASGAAGAVCSGTFGYLLVLSIRGASNSAGGWLIGLLLGAVSLLVMFGEGRLGPQVEAFLLGDFPVWALCLGLVSVAIFSQLMLRTPRLAVTVAETGCPAPVSVWDYQVLGKRQAESTKARESGEIRSGSRRFWRVVGRGYHRGRRRLRVALWRAGHAPARRRLWIVSLLFVAVMGGFQLYVGRHSESAKVPLAPVHWLPVTVIVLVFALCGSVAMWRERLPMLALESLRPLDRRGMRGDIFLALGCDYLCLIAPAMAWWLLSLAFDPAARHGRSLLAGAALAGGTILMLYAIAIWMITIRRTWVAVAWGMVLYVASIFAATAYAALTMVGRQVPGPSSVAGAGLLFLGLGMLLIAAAWRRWLRLEWC